LLLSVLAYSILAYLKQARIEADLEGCYWRVLVLRPTTMRCIASGFAKSGSSNAAACFPNINRMIWRSRRSRSTGWTTWPSRYAKPGQPQVIARVGLFVGDELLNYDLKRRFLFGALFRFWGVSFIYEYRCRLLNGVLALAARFASNLAIHPALNRSRLDCTAMATSGKLTKRQAASRRP